MEGSEHTEITTLNPYVNARFLKFTLEFFNRNIYFLRFISWIKYNVCFCKAAAFASGLVFSYQLIEKVILKVFVTFFSQYRSGFDLKIAAGIVNGQETLYALLLIFMVYLSQTLSSHFKRILFCSISAYACGLMFFGMISFHRFPPSHFSPLTIIVGLIPIAVGRAGLMPFVSRFIVEQLEAHEPDQQNIMEKRVIAREEMWLSFAGGVGLLFSLPLFIYPWPLRLIISGCVLVIAYLMFLLATNSYHKREAAPIAQKPFACIHVVWAAILNRHMEYPSSPNHFFHYNNDELELWPQAKLLRWIDKAAIIESTLGQEAQEKAGRLCDVRMVQETKYILKMVPAWSCFIVFGLVLSAGNTLSSFEGIKLESANKFLIYLILLQSLARGLVSSKLSPLCLLSNWFPKAKLKKNLMRIWGGMVISILYSAVAWRVEVHRLHVFDKNHSFSHHHYDYDISLPMSIWWLAPQYLLLGLMEGLATEGLEHFTNDDEHLSRSMKAFLSAINVFVITGIGSALNILCIYSNKKLFHLTLSDSRLDLYYKYFTMYVTPLNCVYLTMISIFIYGGSEVAQVNEASGTDTAQVNQESMPETTIPDAASLAC